MEMKRRKRKLWYTWTEKGKFRLSEYPPDAPHRTSLEFIYRLEVEKYADDKRADLYWRHQPWTVSSSQRM